MVSRCTNIHSFLYRFGLIWSIAVVSWKNFHIFCVPSCFCFAKRTPVDRTLPLFLQAMSFLDIVYPNVSGREADLNNG